jgi:hypothetical protein
VPELPQEQVLSVARTCPTEEHSIWLSGATYRPGWVLGMELRHHEKSCCWTGPWGAVLSGPLLRGAHMCGVERSCQPCDRVVSVPITRGGVGGPETNVTGQGPHS